MSHKWKCKMCGAELTGETKDEVGEKIKHHAHSAHNVELSPEELDKRKEMIEEV